MPASSNCPFSPCLTATECQSGKLHQRHSPYAGLGDGVIRPFTSSSITVPSSGSGPLCPEDMTALWNSFGEHACRFSSVALYRFLLVLCSVSLSRSGSSYPELLDCTSSCQTSLCGLGVLHRYVKPAIWSLGEAGTATAAQEPGLLGTLFRTWGLSTTGIPQPQAFILLWVGSYWMCRISGEFCYSWYHTGSSMAELDASS